TAPLPRLAERRGAAQLQELRDRQQPQEGTRWRDHVAPSRVREASRLHEPNASPTADHGAAARRDHVAHPLRIRAIGKREDVSVTMPEDVDWRPIPPAAAAADVL